ncbi:unnamed protein product [Calicophoron daubneyi]|uniref:Meiotic nuclear division protein 1 homolog n=1 Tax=Calicophoron daubneyi TaxID=300641 RepID=A0AAV2TTW2_CALDB
MSKRKGLSLEEKRQKMLDFFYEKKDFFQLKEVERLCHKEKGINAMSVKDVLMSLVNDELVDTEKIGTCVYFWAFPNKATQKLKGTIKKLRENIEVTRDQKERTRSALEEVKSIRRDTTERRELLANLAAKKRRLEQLTSELKTLQKFDPARLDELKSDQQKALDAANRWTGEICCIRIGSCFSH